MNGEGESETKCFLVTKGSSGTGRPGIIGAYKRRQAAEWLTLLLATRAQANSGLDQE